MKLSNKILIGFFGFIFFYMIVAFTEIRFRGDLNRFNDSNSISESVDIVNIKYLVLSDLNQRITISGSDNPRIEVKSVSGDLLKELQYDISGDTLTMKPMLLQENQLVTVLIRVSEATFIGLSTRKTGVTISGLVQETLDVVQDDGWIRMRGTNRLNKINLKAENSADFNIINGEVDTLNVTMNHSEVRVSQPLKLVKGSMDNQSYMNLTGTEEIQFKKDESSRLVLN